MVFIVLSTTRVNYPRYIGNDYFGFRVKFCPSVGAAVIPDDRDF